MAGYVSPPPPHPLGQHRPKIEAIREQKGLTPSGFREDGIDAAGADKEAMEREMYRRADAHLPPGIGGSPTADSASDDNAE